MAFIDRRVFCKASGFALAATLIDTSALAKSPVGESKMQQRKIPKSGEAIGIVGLGTSRVFDVGRDVDARQRCVSIVAQLVASGGAFIDTGSAYFSAEQVTGEAARSVGRDQTFLATKVLAEDTITAERQIKASKRRLAPGPIDLLQIHNLSSWQTLLPIAQSLKARGLVRYVGVTHHTNDALPELIRVLNTQDLDFVGFQYSLMEREAEKTLLPLASEKGVAFIANKPFAQGKLFRAFADEPMPPIAHDLECQSWAQYFLRFVVSHPSVTCVIPGTGKLEHAVDNFSAGFPPLPSRAQAVLMAKAVMGT
ncbi:MAG: aldo/keto reductase [Pseudomonadota bacterium]